LLALNAQIYYVQPPPLLTTFAWTVLSAGLCFTPALLLHLHLEYASVPVLIVRPKGDPDQWKRVTLTFAYAFVIFFAVRAYPTLISGQDFDFLAPVNHFGVLFTPLFTTSLAASAGWQIRFAKATAHPKERLFHLFAASGLGICAILVLILHLPNWRPSPQIAASLTATLDFLPIPLFAALIYAVQKYNFLQIGRQTNLMYAISVTFLALLYLGLVRRVSGLLEPVLPPEATASILLFVLVIFVEPMQRLLRKQLHETAQHQMDEVRPLIATIREKAREGDLRGFIQFVGDRVRQQFEFADAWLEVLAPVLTETIRDNAQKVGAEGFSVCQPGLLNAMLFVRPHGAMLSGEITAALELLCEQLPASVDLCRLIEEKLRLERELAERERMAVLGQMAASISHNLKNPLGSIKTILQLQMESAEMPESLKVETRMVLGEVSRLSNKLGQLLQFSRPAVLGGTAVPCDVAEIVNEVSSVMKHEAERKGIQFGVTAEGALSVTASRETVSDIVSNLVVNGLEASGYGGQVRVSVQASNGTAMICVADDGKGIPMELREKVMQPFFSTKTQGTGLGLAIVARRVSEAGGRLELESPVLEGRGTRFSVWLPLKKIEKAK
jgi:signal transduction histidine kinase